MFGTSRSCSPQRPASGFVAPGDNGPPLGCAGPYGPAWPLTGREVLGGGSAMPVEGRLIRGLLHVQVEVLLAGLVAPGVKPSASTAGRERQSRGLPGCAPGPRGRR